MSQLDFGTTTTLVTPHSGDVYKTCTPTHIGARCFSGNPASAGRQRTGSHSRGVRPAGPTDRGVA